MATTSDHIAQQSRHKNIYILTSIRPKTTGKHVNDGALDLEIYYSKSKEMPHLQIVSYHPGHSYSTDTKS